MRKIWRCLLGGMVVTGGLLLIPILGYASEENGNEVSYDQVATEEEQVKPQEVGVEGMTPIYATDVADGVYEVEVESSSSMFRVEHAELTVQDGEMAAVLTMGGTGYLRLYMGTKEEAAMGEISDYIEFEEDDEGKHTYTIPVEALDLPIDCAAFSKNRERWYDRQILFQAESLPSEAVLVELPDYEALRREAKERRIEALRAEKEETEDKTSDTKEESAPATAKGPAFIEMEDGEYAIEVELSGGSGRSTVNSPAGLIVKDGLAWARITWSSSNYDYMIVGNEKYLNLQEEGYSMFEIPILAFNEPVTVIADTTAMSTPHEVEYALTFYGDRVMSKDETPQAAAQKVVYMVLVIIVVCALVSYWNKKKRNGRR